MSNGNAGARVIMNCPLHRGPNQECRWDITRGNGDFLDHLSKTGGQAIVDALDEIKNDLSTSIATPADYASLRRHPAYAVLDRYPIEIEIIREVL